MRFFILSLLSCTLFSACQSVTDANQGSNGNGPVTALDQATFEKAIDGSGRMERSLLVSSSDTATSDTVLNDMRSQVRTSNCSIADSIHGGATLTSSQSLSVVGNGCALQARATRTNTNGKLHLMASFEIRDQDLILRNGIQSMSISGNGTVLQLTSSQGTQVKFNYGGQIQTSDGKSIQVQGSQSIRRFATTSGLATFSGTRTLTLSLGSSQSTLQLTTDGTQTQYFLNYDQITQTVYENYLSRLGSLLAGAFNDAG